MAESILSMVEALWKKLEDYFLIDPEFKTTLSPHRLKNNAPEEASVMAGASSRAGIGPMSAVAGMFSERVGQHLLEEYHPTEIVVENGGDIFLKIENDLVLSVFAGTSPLSEKIAVKVPASETPLGICTSSGTVGPSLSFGIADAVMVACRSTPLADAYATALGNKVQSPDVIGEVLSKSENYPEILSIIIICRDKMGIRGNFEAKFL